MVKKLKLHVEHDPFAENPSDWEGWKVHSFSPRHASFKDPKEFELAEIDGELSSRDEDLKKKLDEGQAFFLSYFEHSVSIWSLMGEKRLGTEGDWRWDGVDVGGLVIWDPPNEDFQPDENWNYEKWQQSARAFIADYTAWCNGYTYMFSLTEAHKCGHCGHIADDVVDACGGFLVDNEEQRKHFIDSVLEMKPEDSEISEIQDDYLGLSLEDFSVATSSST